MAKQKRSGISLEGDGIPVSKSSRASESFDLSGFHELMTDYERRAIHYPMGQEYVSMLDDIHPNFWVGLGP